MQPGESGADRRAMKWLDTARPHSGEEGHQCRRAAAQFAQGSAVPALDRGRAGDVLCREMLHQSDEKRQILERDPLFIERQDEIAALGGDEKVRVLDTLGDALARQHLADVVKRDKGSELVIGNVGIYSHRFFCRVIYLESAPGRLVCSARLAYSPAAANRRRAL